MDEYFVVDSKGVVFYLRDVRMKHRRGAITRLLFSLLNPIVEVNYNDISVGSQMDANGLKERMLEDIEQNHEFWSDVADIEHLVEKIKECNAIRSLMDIRGQVGDGVSPENANRPKAGE